MILELRARPAGFRHLVDAHNPRAANFPHVSPAVCGKVPRQGWEPTWPVAIEQCPQCLDLHPEAAE